MTAQVQATIAGLVSEIDHLKVRVKRYERTKAKNDPNADSGYLFGEAFIRALDKALDGPPPAGYIRELVLVVVNTFEGHSSKFWLAFGEWCARRRCYPSG
jgi:hypothetical protein